jgi:Acyltransferase
MKITVKPDKPFVIPSALNVPGLMESNLYTNALAARPKKQSLPEQFFRRVEMCVRLLGSIPMRLAFLDKNNRQKAQLLLNTQPGTPDYINHYETLARAMHHVKPMDVTINTEGGRLQKLKQSKTPTLFLINHDFQQSDPKMLALFHVMLYGQNHHIPNPKTVVNQDILLSQPKPMRQVLQHFGLTGVDASLINPDPKCNQKAMTPLVKGFVKGNNHIFMFPEGRAAVNRQVPFTQRVQHGAGQLAQTLLALNKKIKVVSLGFAYDKPSNTGSIYMARPTFIKQQGRQLHATMPEADGRNGLDIQTLPNQKKTPFQLLGLKPKMAGDTVIQHYLTYQMDVARRKAFQQLRQSSDQPARLI